ncbi:MAG: carboxypeptidase regulatory-like domain-containing protein, partial [Planctomycetes bacterium]|nr:carboxypeptidase regulatory-like domain-containing protein [Planctomycetota bacterium]
VVGAGDDGASVELDSGVLFRNRRTQRIAAATSRDVNLFKFGGYHSAYPGQTFIAEVFVRGQRTRLEGGGPWLAAETSSGRGELLATGKAYASGFRDNGEWHRITAAVHAPPKASRIRVSFGIDGAAGTFWFSEPFIGEAEFPLPTDAAYRTTGYVPPAFEANQTFFAQASVDPQDRNANLKVAAVTGRVTDFRARPLPHTAIATDDPLFVAVTDAGGRFRLTVPAGRNLRIRAFPVDQAAVVSDAVRLAVGQRLDIDMHVPPPPANPQLVNGGFNQFNRHEAGLVPGWTTFGTTDGACASGKMIFEVPSFEGEGLYFAQSGSNTKNGGAHQLVVAVAGRKYRLSGRVYTRTEGGGKQPLDNNCRLGIDPTGGRDPRSPDVIWTPAVESDQKWTPIAVEATATTERITVFLSHEMRRANTWNLTLFDDVRLDSLP